MVYQFFGNKEGGFTLPVFAGPMITRIKFNQTVTKSYGQIANQPLSGQVHTDFDMDGNQFVPGFMAGVQAGIPLGKYFKAVPYAMAGFLFQEDLSYTLGTVRTDRESSGMGMLVRVRNGDKMQIERKIGTIGLNLVFKPWGLSLNLTGPILTKALLGKKDLEITQFSLSYSFGKYEK